MTTRANRTPKAVREVDRPTPPATPARIGAITLSLLVTWAPAAALALDKEKSLLNGRAVGELAVAGRLSIDLHAGFMVSREYGTETVLNWYNCGYSGGGGADGRATQVGGNFGDFGFQVPLTERQEKYPHAVTLDKVPAVHFDGGDSLKGNFAVEPRIASGGGMAVEVWFRCPQPAKGGSLLGWQSPAGGETSAPIRLPAEFKGSNQWTHLVVNCRPGEEEWFLDGVKVGRMKRMTVVKPGHVMVLGGESATRPSFKGELAAVRLHDEAMTIEEITRNFKGGVMLGTEMHDWWRIEPDKWFVVGSEHFRHAVDKAEMAKWSARQRKEFDERVPGMLHLAELVYRTYSERLALRSSVVSRRPQHRGDGIKYRIPIQPTDGGNYMGVDDDFGWACQFAGFINPHELVHGWQAMTGGMQGNYWETHANFPQTYNGIYQTIPLVIAEGPSCPSSGRTYYHDRLMFEHLAQTPEYGPMFISKLWYDGPTAAEDSPYPWQTFTRLDPDPATPLGYEWTRMAQRMITWDFTTFAEAQPGGGNTADGNDGVPRAENLYQQVARDNAADIRRFARVVLEKIPHEPDWWRVPKEQAPQQLGWNICPLEFKAGRVSATLAGYINPARGSDWRAAFVGVGASGKPVYGDVFGPGKTMSFHAGGDLGELFLVVCAVPTNIMPIEMTGDFRSFEQEQFPYRVKFAGCTPVAGKLSDPPAEEGAPHANGGGFVARTAQVDARAWVGPGARVLGDSKVLGNARIEDHAVIRDATARDNAVVSGHALVHEGSTVAGNAKVRDHAVVKAASTVRGDARILEHATLASRKTCGDRVTVKGIANVYGGSQAGTALIDGFYAKGNEITKGKWFTWSWGQGRNPGEIDEDFGGLYADYGFESEHPWMARDDFGATWGYLAGSPKLWFTPEKEHARSTLLTPESVLKSFDREQHDENGYSELLSAYLEPPETGDYTFWISADDEGELRIGDAGSDRADRKLCGNPMWAGFRDYGRFPSQKSQPVRLERGRRYPLHALHGNGHMGGSLSVSWSKPGSGRPEPIPDRCLSTTADGRARGVRQRVWGGVTQTGQLVNRPDFPGGVLREGGHSLALNGVNQFVELPKDVADLRGCAYTVDFKWAGGVDGQRVFEFANPNGDAVRLCPAEQGRMIFAIRKGGKVDILSTPAIRPNVWVSVRVSLAGTRATLAVNGKQAAVNTAMTLAPDSIRATQCYLGRGLKGNHFRGLIDRFTIHTIPADNP